MSISAILQNKDKRNYLIHQLYVRQDFEECIKLIDEVLEDSENLCEYALHTKALIKRHNGEASLLPLKDLSYAWSPLRMESINTPYR
jgi:Bardet-Biedl syndrome 4 protein